MYFGLAFVITFAWITIYLILAHIYMHGDDMLRWYIEYHDGTIWCVMIWVRYHVGIIWCVMIMDRVPCRYVIILMRKERWCAHLASMHSLICSMWFYLVHVVLRVTLLWWMMKESCDCKWGGPLRGLG